MNQKIATIFGGSGFIGRHLIRRLTEKEYRIIVATRSPYLSGHLKPLGNPGQVELVKTNIYYDLESSLSMNDYKCYVTNNIWKQEINYKT